MDPKVPVFFLVSFFLHGCCGQECQFDRVVNPPDGEGGGTDAIVADLPFSAGYQARCVQGANGSYSHKYTSTKYDLDLDTPNDQNDLVYAPMNGTAYVHDDGSHGFGRHVNLDLHDGTYLLMGHLEDVFVGNGTDVTAGQILGFEGTTGASTGDHVHFGRHSGNAQKPADVGASLSGLKLRAVDLASGNEVEVMTTDAVCSLSGGHVYQSELSTAHWHPVGSLLKQAGDSLVYERTSGNGLLAFMNEGAFLSRGLNFADVVLVSPEELECYGETVAEFSASHVSALRDSHDDAWLLIGESTDPERQRFRVDETGTAGLLASYGIRASSYDDIDHGSDAGISLYPNAGRATYRDGALLSQVGKPDVYIMDEGVAMPIADWDTFLLLGFGERDIIPVTGDELATNVKAKGNCQTDMFCITKNDITECAHSEEVDHEQQGDEDSGSGVSEGTDSGDDTAAAVEGEAFQLRWTTPGQVRADWLTVAGIWTYSSGQVTDWNSVLADAHSSSSLDYSRSDAKPGDKLRFSVAYGIGSVESWSCLAPFPPGTIQGIIDAKVNGQSVTTRAVADPNSAGCQLELEIP
jgi:hypothetical protein